MLGDLQRQKAAYYFDLIDEDDNGLIEPADFRLRAERLADAFDVTDAEERQRLQHRVMEWWEHLSSLADMNDDEQITREEWRQYWIRFKVAVSMGNPRQSIENLERAARKTFRAVDHTDSGRITEDEFSSWLTAWGIKAGKQVFRQLDRDDKGFLTEDDLTEATTEFYLSNDPAAPGNVLYGPLPDDVSTL